MTEVVHLILSSGTGPVECSLAVQYLIESMKADAAMMAIKVEDSTPKRKDAELPRSVIVTLSGEKVEWFAQRYMGTVRVIFKSPIRSGHKRQNWYVGVQKLDDALINDEVAVVLDETEVRFETLRAGGPGGQHQNTTDSAVRAIHIPSGLSTLAREERSQHRNKAVALRRLSAMLQVLAEGDKENGKRKVFQQHRSLERGNEVLTIRR